MGRLREDFLERVESFSDRVLDVAETLEKQGRSARIVDQMMGCGSSVGANVFEADEALSAGDFCKCVGISNKEANETRFWIRLARRRGWIPADRLSGVLQEAEELKKIFGAMIVKTRENQL